MFICQNKTGNSIEIDRFFIGYNSEIYTRKAYTSFTFKPSLSIEIGQNVPERKEFYDIFFSDDNITTLSFYLDGNLVKQITSTNAHTNLVTVDETRGSLNVIIYDIEG
jgi:hypothetical protein